MKKNFLLLSLVLLFSRFCFSNTATLDQYELKLHDPVINNESTSIEGVNKEAFTVLLDNGQLFSWKPTLWSFDKEPIEDEKIVGNDIIQAPVVPLGKRVKEVFSSAFAFSALLDDGSILYWDNSSKLESEPPYLAPDRKVISIASNSFGFVGILDNGTVLSWGSISDPLPQSLLTAEDQGKKVISVTSSPVGFAALTIDPITSQKSIIFWSHREATGDYFEETNLIEKNEGILQVPMGREVVSIIGNAIMSREADETVLPLYAWLVLYDNGEVKTFAWHVWSRTIIERSKQFPEGFDYYTYFFITAEIKDLPSKKKATALAATNSAFAILFEDGTIECLGNEYNGGKTPNLPAGATVKKIFSAEYDFIALLSDGNILSWGRWSAFDSNHPYSAFYGKSRLISVGPLQFFYPDWWHVICKRPSLQLIATTQETFAALFDTGKIITWGFKNEFWHYPSAPIHHKKIISITPCRGNQSELATGGSFTTLFEDGTIQSWGIYDDDTIEDCGGGTPKNFPKGRRVQALYSTSYTYMALLDDNSLFVWGDSKRKTSGHSDDYVNGKLFRWTGFIDEDCKDGKVVPLPEGAKALWIASPFEKRTLKLDGLDSSTALLEDGTIQP